MKRSNVYNSAHDVVGAVAVAVAGGELKGAR